MNGNILVSRGYIGGGAYYFTGFSVPASDLVNGINTLTVIQDGTDDYLEAMRFEGTLTVSSVPIPGALLLFGPGLVGLAAIKRQFGK